METNNRKGEYTMKRLSKILAVLLAVLMAGSLLFVPAIAEDDPYASLKEGIVLRRGKKNYMKVTL